jgi:hypothetical protein
MTGDGALAQPEKLGRLGLRDLVPRDFAAHTV